MTLRILHILDHSLPLHSGYTFRTRAIMKAQAAKGWHVMGVTGLRHTMDGPAHEEAEGLRFARTPRGRTGILPLEIDEIGRLAAQVAATARSFRPDILHAHSPALCGMAASIAARKLGLPLLYEIRAFWEDAAVSNGTSTAGSIKYLATRWLEDRVVARADAVAVICNGLSSDLIARGVPSDKIMISPNGVDLEMFGDPPLPDAALAIELGLTGKAVIGFIGSFYDYEGLDDLIAAMPAIPEADLVLVGGGPMEIALRQQAADSHARDRIHFIGRVPHDQVERYYSLIDVLVYPRKRQRLTDLVTPLKPLEAMAQRRLVAGSDVGGHRELIEDGVTGTLFPPDDPHALAASIRNLLADRAHWDERRRVARAFVERDRNWSSNISRYDPVYRKLAGRPV